MAQFDIKTFDDEAALFAELTKAVTNALDKELARCGACSLLLSGGSTPEPLYRALADAPLDWPHIHTALVDERWVDKDDAGSNTALVERSLLQGAAAQSPFTAMKTSQATALEAIDNVHHAYALLPHPAIAILGMGPDGHTASWFKGAPEYAAAIDPRNEELVAAISAPQSDVTGNYLERMTITAHAMQSWAQAFLIVKGAEKIAVLENCLDENGADLPMRHAGQLLGARLQIFALS